MKVFTPPDKYRSPYSKSFSIFLAGTIDMGNSEDWQAVAIKFIESNFSYYEELVIYNPRRKNWDSSWAQKESEDHFNEQVNWELNHLDESDLVLLHLEGSSKSPISLMELGYLANSNKLIVSCSERFYRRGNVEILCTRHKIPLHRTLDSALGALMTILRQNNI